MLNFGASLPLDSEGKKYSLLNARVLTKFLSANDNNNSEKIEKGMQIEKFLENLKHVSDLYISVSNSNEITETSVMEFRVVEGKNNSLS